MQSSRAKSCSQPANLPGARPLMNPLPAWTLVTLEMKRKLHGVKTSGVVTRDTQKKKLANR